MVKDVAFARDLVPIGQFKSKAAALLKTLAEDGRTLVITQNGTAAAVVMSPQEFDELQYRKRLVEDIARALTDVDRGATRTTDQVRKALAKRRRARSTK